MDNQIPSVPAFLRRLDFSSTEEYATYVRDRITLGMRVRFCLSFLKNNSKLRIGDTGIVIHIDRNGRQHELNVEVFFIFIIKLLVNIRNGNVIFLSG